MDLDLEDEDRRERIRLRAVRATGLADERGSPVLDALARVALRAVRAHAVFVTLVDEASLFVPGRAGDGVEVPARRIPIAQAACRLLLGRTTPLVIADTASSILRDTPPVTELGIQAYLGVPLGDGRGSTLGALCAVSRTPRAWTEEEVRTLEELAVAARAELAHAELQERYDHALAAPSASTAAQLAAIVSSSSLPIVSTSRDGVVRTWNRAAELMFGRSAADMIGAPLALLTPPELVERDVSLSALALVGEAVEEVETLRLRADGTVVSVLLTISPMVDEGGRVIGLSTMFRDISRAKQLEAELRQAQKLEAMGRLASGVAHDFNNLLTVIHANAELLRGDLGEGVGGTATEDVDEIVRTVSRASALTRQLLAFGRKQVVAPRLLPLDEVVEGTATMLRRVLGADVRLETALAAARLVVQADRGQLEQVLVNLAVNARDAMPHGGTLRVTTTAGQPGRRPPDAPTAPVFEGPFVVLAVSDTGTGMDEQTLANAFEPFFTTKEEGRGTGLGLSTVYGIISQSGGITWITSKRGTGTTVWLALPRTGETATPEPPRSSDPAHARTRRRVLVVDDDRSVLASVTRFLERRGYEVLPCPSGEQALEVWTREDAEGRRLDALVTDLSLPGIEGRALAARLRERRPELPVVVMSAHGDAEPRRTPDDPRLRFLEKPFEPDHLVEALEQLTRR